MTFSGKVAIITGAARGIGLAVASRFVSEGASVMICDVLSEAGHAAAHQLSKSGTSAFIEADLGDSNNISTVVEATMQRFGRIDILVCNAGIAAATPFLDVQEDEFDRTMLINVKSTFLMCQAAAKRMLENKARGKFNKGAIVLMSSTGAVLGSDDKVPYTTSKGAVNSMMKGMAVALGPLGIRVNAVGPGVTVTDMAKNYLLGDREALEAALSRTPLSRLAEPIEIASCVAFLASEDATYVNGQTLYVDGGKLSLNYVMKKEYLLAAKDLDEL